MNNLENEIIEFVCDHTGASAKRVSLDTRLFHDLGIDGDDGLELIEAFANRYDVDLSGMDLSRHFGPEAGGTPLTLLRWLISPSFRKGEQITPIRIGDLVACAKANRWLL